MATWLVTKADLDAKPASQVTLNLRQLMEASTLQEMETGGLDLEGLSDVDEEEVAKMILKKEERVLKSRIWKSRN